MGKEELAIGQVAKAAGITASALRYYEGVGLVPEPPRINGRRLYDRSIFPYLAAIRLAQESGFTVAETKQLLDSCAETSSRPIKGRPKADGWKGLAKAKIDELDRSIARADAMKTLLNKWLECECVSLADCELIADRLQGAARPL